jgi:hypothetical protein
LITLATLAAMLGLLAYIIWQLRLARTKGMVRGRNGIVLRADNPSTFQVCVVGYWIFLVWGTGMLIGILVSAFRQTSN